ncbi:MAG: aldehyde ferredoxin oxidoreductase family protein [Anaerolineae bacterium]|nr:aldehyde ferredoxin oxidoreductase family protein [Anaerolineae bacterium]
MEQKFAGFWNRILRVDLTSRTTQVVELDPLLYRYYMGGRNLALHFLLKEVAPDTKPLSPQNKLILMTSVVTGAPISGQARHTAAAISPLTGGLADSQCGGWWGAELKFATWDGIIIEGKADKLVYLWIEDEHVQILPADDLHGRLTHEVMEILRNRHGAKARTLQCGIAGENLVRYANITADCRNFHGRGGLGAVMGSKNLRAVAVRGTHRRLKIADPEKLNQIATWFSRSVKIHPAVSLHHELGTSKGIVPVSVAGMLPTYNFQDGSFEGAEKIGGETMKRELNGSTETCYACAVSCKRSVEGEKGAFKVTRNYGGPEYESIGLLGSNLGVDDIYAVAACNERCNALGLDTISTGLTLSWAVECFERGLISEADTGGLRLKWNDPHTYLDLIDAIASRRGFGDLLAEGSWAAASKIGRGSEKYSMTSKGQEFANHEPRGKWGVALGYAVSPTGADHLQAAHDPWFTNPGDPSAEFNWVDLTDLNPTGILEPVPAEDLSAAKVRLFIYLQYIWGVHDVLDWCIFTAVPEFRAISLNQLAEVVGAVTGWKTSLFEVLKAGERGVTMARAFNVRRGFSADDDRLPDRMFEPLRGGTLKGHCIDRQQFERGKQLYYAMMGWDERGVPGEAKLEELGVGWVWQLLAERSAAGRQ